MTDKSESKPKGTRKDDDEVPELDRLREEGLRRSPLSQTQHLDTTEGYVDLRTVSPVFEETRRDAVRHAADVVDPNTDTHDPNVILPDDEDARERVEEDLKNEAADLPEKDEDLRSGYGDGMGDLYNEEGQTAQRQAEEQKQAEEEKAASSRATGTKSAAKPSTASKTTSKSTSTRSSTTK